MTRQPGRSTSLARWSTVSSSSCPTAALKQPEQTTASAEELQMLSGIGPALSSAIIAYRDENGPFTAVEQLEEVPGIGPAMMSRLASLVKL